MAAECSGLGTGVACLLGLSGLVVEEARVGSLCDGSLVLLLLGSGEALPGCLGAAVGWRLGLSVRVLLRLLLALGLVLLRIVLLVVVLGVGVVGGRRRGKSMTLARVDGRHDGQTK